MIKGVMNQQQQQQQQQQHVYLEENMSNLTSASGEASASSSNRVEPSSATIFTHPHHYFAPQNQTQQQQQQEQQQQPPAKKKRNLPGNPDPDAEVIALSPKALLATNRFVCEICNKGFQRDQNLQLHRRGHNLPWKLKQRNPKEVRKKVYVCPEPSCVHHDPSRALGDLTGIKKHFCRKHGEKKWKCEKCSKRYAVQSDWKAHSKVCGTREYRCDCGTLFSRRDSFITHRAFCDALAEETARAITTNSLLTAAVAAAAGSSSSASHLMNLQPPPFTTSITTTATTAPTGGSLLSFPLKREPHFNLPPWLSCPPQPHHQAMYDHTSDMMGHQMGMQNEGPNPSIGPTMGAGYHSHATPQMSATALLQKAAQMGATMSNKNTSHVTPTSTNTGVDHNNTNSSSRDTNMTISSTAGLFGLNLSSRDQQDLGSGYVSHSLSCFGNKAPPPPAAPTTVPSHITGCSATALPPPPSTSSLLLQDMMMNSFSTSSSYDDAFATMLNGPKKLDGPFTAAFQQTLGGHDSGGTHGSGGDGLTRDFLGLRPLSQSEILNMAGFGNLEGNNDSNQSQIHKPWQG